MVFSIFSKVQNSKPLLRDLYSLKHHHIISQIFTSFYVTKNPLIFNHYHSK